MKAFRQDIWRRPSAAFVSSRSATPPSLAASVSKTEPPDASIRCERLRVDEIANLGSLEALPEDLNKMVVSIRETGPLELMRVRPATQSDGINVRFVTISGALRLEAMKRAGIQEVFAIIDCETRPELLEEKALASNHDRRNKHFITRAEEALRLADLRLAKAPQRAEPPVGGQQPNDKQQSARARVLGVSSDTVARYEIVAGLAAEVKLAAKAAGIKQNRLLKIARLKKIEDQLKAVDSAGTPPRERTRQRPARIQQASVSTADAEVVRRAGAVDHEANSATLSSSKNLLPPPDFPPLPSSLDRRDPAKAFQIFLEQWHQSDLSRQFESAPAETRRLFVAELTRSASLPEDSHE